MLLLWFNDGDWTLIILKFWYSIYIHGTDNIGNSFDDTITSKGNLKILFILFSDDIFLRKITDLLYLLEFWFIFIYENNIKE